MVADNLRALALLCVLLCLPGCGGDPELPPAQPLSADRQVIAGLYGAAPGPLSVSSAKNLQLTGAEDERVLDFNLYYPETGEAYPLLIFSHGNWSNRESYDLLIHHWVSHGYAVIAPDHLDCCGMASGIFNSLRYGQLGLIEARVEDLGRLLSSLAQIEQLHPEFKGKADPSRLGITGHSFGAFTAQQFGGAQVFNPDADEYQGKPDTRVAAIVAVSPPGPMFDLITEESWLHLAAPTLIATGTWDIQPSFWPDWRMHLMSHETAQPGQQYALITQGADHFLGNLICRTEREAEPQHDALTMLHIATTAFLDAYVKGNPTARDFLDNQPLRDITAGFSELRMR